MRFLVILALAVFCLAASSMAVERGLVECQACIKGVSYVEEELAGVENKTEADIEKLLHEACGLFGALEKECVLVVNHYIGELVNGIMNDTAPRNLCEDIGACKKAEFFGPMPDWMGDWEDTPGAHLATAACTLGTAGGCSTGVALGLTNQIASELTSMGYTFTTLDSTWIHCSDPCVNKMQATPASKLKSAAQSKNDYITLNSAWRSSAQQYLLYNWYQKGQCGITLAAKPGTSNHEGGRAIDTSYYSYWESTLNAYGWTRCCPSSDPVHFDYNAAPDLRSQNLKAFQKLWNKHNPSSTISEDGVYGPATANALSKAPCSGW